MKTHIHHPKSKAPAPNVWSVYLSGRPVKEGVSESEAWGAFIKSAEPGQLLRGKIIMAERTYKRALPPKGK